MGYNFIWRKRNQCTSRTKWEVIRKARAGAGNDNGAKVAIFQEQNKVAKESGTMEYSFIPETKGEDTRFGFYPHYIDNNNFVFVGYDSLGWFYEYKYQGKGDWLKLDLMFHFQRLGLRILLKLIIIKRL